MSTKQGQKIVVELQYKESLPRSLPNNGLNQAGPQSDLMRLPSFKPFILTKGFPRPLHFAGRIYAKKQQYLGVCSYDFLASFFGEKFAATEAKAWSGSMIYKKLSGGIHKSFYSFWSQLTLSLNLSGLSQQSFQTWLNHAPLARLLETIVLTRSQRAPSTTPVLAPREFFHSLQPPAMVHRESREVLKPVEKNLHVRLDREFEREIKTTPIRTTMRRNYFDTQALHSEPQRFNLRVKGRSAISPRDLPRQAAVSYLLSSSQLVSPRFETQFKQFKSVVNREVKKVTQNSFVESLVLASRFFLKDGKTDAVHIPWVMCDSRAMSGEGRGAGRDTVHIPWVMRDPRTITLKFSPEAPCAPQLNQYLVTSAFRPTAGADNGIRDCALHEFAFVRQAEHLPPPAFSYVFAQPLRPAVAEGKVIKKVEEREVVEMVKKEVQTFISSGEATQNFSHADYTRITDHVYSDLMRRLMMEKERLGWRA